MLEYKVSSVGRHVKRWREQLYIDTESVGVPIV